MAKTFTIFMDGFAKNKQSLTVGTQNTLYNIRFRCNQPTGDYITSTLPYRKELSITSAAAILASVIDAQFLGSIPTVDSTAIIDCLVVDFKKDGFISGDTAMVPHADLISASIVDGRSSAETSFCIDQTVENLCYEKAMSANSEIRIAAYITESLMRYRLLSDMDGQTISAYDDMDLNTLDLIIT